MCDQDNNDDERFNAMFAGGVFAVALGVAAAALANALGAVVGAIAFTGIVAAVVTYVPSTLAFVWLLRRLA